MRGHMSTAKIAAALTTCAGIAAVAFQFSGNNVSAQEEVKGSRLKKTLSNGGLWPEPDKKTLKTRPSGDMALFTQGGSVADTVLAKEGGKAL